MKIRIDSPATKASSWPITLAIPVWGKRISPVFDAATALLIVDLTMEGPIYREQQGFSCGSSEQVLALMATYNAAILVCGAISQEPAKMLEAAGITLVPFVSGKIERIVELLWRRKSICGCLMPGCRRLGMPDEWVLGPRHRKTQTADGGTDMPGLNGKGPQGKGPRTGSGRGKCQTERLGAGPGRGCSAKQEAGGRGLRERGRRQGKGPAGAGRMPAASETATECTGEANSDDKEQLIDNGNSTTPL